MLYPAPRMALGGGTDWVGRFLRGEGGKHVEREALHEYHQPRYSNGVSFKGALIVVTLFVLIIVGVFVLFT